jgi:polyisoprenoid-binding protein YceI
MILFLALAIPAQAADNYKVDEGHSAVLFKAHHFGAGYVWGRFNNMEGTFEVDGKVAKSFQFSVNTGSVDSGNEKRDKHLRSPDFLSADEFPTATFTSKSCDAKGCTGDFTLHGVTKQIVVPLTYTGEGKDPWGGYRLGFETQFTINSADYRVGQPGPADGIGDELTLTVAVEGKKKK